MNKTLFPRIVRTMINMNWDTLEQSYLNSVALANRFGGQVYYCLHHDYPIVLISGTFYYWASIGEIKYIDEDKLTFSSPLSSELRQVWDNRVASSRRERYIAL